MAMSRPLVCLAALAFFGMPAAFAADIRIDEIRTKQGSTTTVFSNIKVSDSSLTEAEWRTALAATELSKANAILLKFDAARLTVERIEVESQHSDGKTKSLFTQIEFNTIAKGRAASGTFGRGEIRSDNGKERDTTRFDRIALRNAALALPPKPADGALPLALEEAVIDNIRTENSKGAAGAIRTVRIENIRAALLDDKVLTVLHLLDGRDFDQLNPLEKAAGAKALSETYHAFALGRITAEDLANRDGTERVAIKRVVLEGGAKPSFSMDGIEMKIGDETTRIGAFRLDDFSLDPTIKTLLNTLGDATAKGEPPLGELLPRLGAISFSDIAVTGSKISAYGGESALKSFRVEFNNPSGGVPTGMRISFDGLAAAIDKSDPNAAELLALGYQKLDASGAIDIDVDKARDVLNFREVSLRIKDIGTLHLTGSVAKIGDVLQAKDSDEAALAAMSLTIRTLGIGLANEGLFERVLAKNAKETGKSPDQVKREIASLAALGLPGLIGTSPQAKAIVDASMRFLAKPERIVFAFKSKSPDGIGFADMIGIGTPDDFFALTDITIRAGP